MQRSQGASLRHGPRARRSARAAPLPHVLARRLTERAPLLVRTYSRAPLLFRTYSRALLLLFRTYSRALLLVRTYSPGD